ncbi:protein of unknown function DUF6 transmembrane [Methanococcus vannielii SB]|uniref:EamA domain-containing protein n=1 Tax=Methanococcus vannielii (strain ATCC 35089 / DSM 1224 / JCM 13029 / OCM 148 / SB) TaxID=406327 RepID=A6UN46_METVS|nr:DMT family transporter [Methanococcus vannielii]ABR53918.1 protein of unknown function DUF6 transmembrane [Methanococcus vannielii SB]
MSKVKGIMYTLISSILFGIMPFLTKYAYLGGANAVTTLLLRFLIAAVAIYFILNIKNINLRIDRNIFLEILVYGAFLYALNTIWLYESYNYIPTGIATTLHFTYPVFVMLAMITVFKEKIGTNKVISMVFLFFGLYSLVGMNWTNLDFLGIIFSAGSGLIYAGYIVSAEKCSFSKLDPYVTIFYLSLLSAIFLFIYGFSTNSLTFKMDTSSYLLIIIISLFCTVLALVTFLKGIKLIGPSNTAMLSTLEPIVSILIGIIVLHEVLSLEMAFGSIMIIISVFLVATENC